MECDYYTETVILENEDKVRRKLEKLLKGYEDVHFEAAFATGEGIIVGMRSSKFCLHPAGDTPSFNRLFDAIVSHYVPVIVSDHIEHLFESDLDYSKFALFFSVK
nr:probable arabinosyltransferase ARAD1 [Tanacetum cinerariifolium]